MQSIIVKKQLGLAASIQASDMENICKSSSKFDSLANTLAKVAQAIWYQCAQEQNQKQKCQIRNKIYLNQAKSSKFKKFKTSNQKPQQLAIA